MCVGYFLWEHTKDMIYQQKLQTRELVQWIMESTDNVIGNDEFVRQATNSLLRKANFCIQNIAG
jgi:hypothetical protein